MESTTSATLLHFTLKTWTTSNYNGFSVKFYTSMHCVSFLRTVVTTSGNEMQHCDQPMKADLKANNLNGCCHPAAATRLLPPGCCHPAAATVRKARKLLAASALPRNLP
jgi:hypothetical protein